MSDVQPATDFIEPEAPAALVGSPAWWLERLDQELVRRTKLVQLYEDYYEGRHQLAFATAKFREVFAEMLAAVSDNWMALVVEASVERLRVEGFRFGESDGDEDAWRIWQQNALDADSRLAFREAIKHGEAYLLTWWEDREAPGVFGRFFRRRSQPRARITVEHPSQVIVAREAGDRRRRAAALKKWQEDDGRVMATLYLPGSIHRFQRDDRRGRWEARQGVEEQERNPLGVVPVVPLVNDPHMLPCYPPQSLLAPPHRAPRAAVGLGRSDLADVISTQDQINKLLCDMMVASEVGAYRQRWATGLEVPVNEETGEPLEPYQHAINRLWTSASSETNFGEFSATELANFTAAYEGRVQSLASRTRTPPHYLLGQSGNFPSGESLKATETGLVAKVEDKQGSYDDGLEESMRIAFAVEGDERAGVEDAETHWRQAESRSESEYVDSLTKKRSLGVPLRQLWEDAGYSPQQISRFREMLREEAELRGLLPAETAMPAEGALA